MALRERHEFDDEEDDERDDLVADRDAPSPADLDGADDDDDTVPCPYCGKPVYDGAERCPRCGNFLSAEDAPGRRHPWWIWAGVILCLLGVLLWVF